MNDTIVIGGQTDLDGHIDGEVNIKTEVAGECGIFFPVTPPPAPVEELVIKDVMFMDYDGSVVASYDAADFIANVTALPTPPSHDGLTFQEWNWDLADIKTELQTGSGACCIGACYETTDGKTHFIIELKAEDGVKDIQFYRVMRSGNLTVEWGDGTVETFSGNNLTKHSYADYGEYDIAVSGNWSIVSNNRFMRAQNPLAAGSYTGYNLVNQFLKKVFTSSTVRLYANGSGNYTFVECPNLTEFSVSKELLSLTSITSPWNFEYVFQRSGIKFFTFPKGCFDSVSFVDYAFYSTFDSCRNLVSFSLPKLPAGDFPFNQVTPFTGAKFFFIPSVTTLKAGTGYLSFQNNRYLKRVAMKFDNYSTTYGNGFYVAFSNDTVLKDVSFDKMEITGKTTNFFQLCESYNKPITISAGVTSISGDFSNCFSAPKFTFLGNLTSIGASTFYNCFACLEYDFTHCTAVPTLASTNAFMGINTNAKIKVPASLESSWKTAANWSNYASYIVGV